MLLDDFLAKKEKKKSKPKQTPQSLIKKLTKETEKAKKAQDTPSNVVPDPNKIVAQGGEPSDEWEAIEDDEKEIDLQNIRIGKLSVTKGDDLSKGVKDKEKRNAESGQEEEKKVWGPKSTELKEEPAVEPEPDPEPIVEPEAPKPKLYVPAPLREGRRLSGGRIPAVKPNVSSAEDFPTLDVAAVAAEVAAKKSEQAPATIEPTDGSWQQAGTPRRANRGPDSIPLAVGCAPTAYVPPSLRHGSNEITHAVIPTPAHEYSSSGTRPSRFREETNRVESTGGRWHGGEDFNRGMHVEPSSNDWMRGKTVTSVESSITSTVGLPTPVRPAPESKSSDWSRGSYIKSFRESTQDKNTFELTQSNRFAGLGET